MRPFGALNARAAPTTLRRRRAAAAPPPPRADVFAGFDLTLRGGNVIHREYLQVGKGREMMFIPHMQFISKLARGSAEVTMTRQSYRLGTRLTFSRLLGFFYGHVGHYLTPVMMELTTWMIVFSLMYFTLCDARFKNGLAAAVRARAATAAGPTGELPDSYASIAADLVDSQFGPLAVLFITAQAVPLLFETTLNRGFGAGLWALVLQFVSLSSLFFAFQSQLTGFYFRQELSAGGAAYVGTGRGMASTRASFDLLYRTFSQPCIVPGAEVGLMLAVVVLAAPARLPAVGFWVGMALVLASWIFSPFIFNPHHFSLTKILRVDLCDWARWVVQDGRHGWAHWRQQALLDMSSRRWWSFAYPGRRVLAAFVLLCLLNDVEQRPYRYDVLELALIAVPVLPIALAALVTVPLRMIGKRLDERAAREAACARAAELPPPSPPQPLVTVPLSRSAVFAWVVPALAIALVGWHTVELWVHARFGAFVFAFGVGGSHAPLRFDELLVVATAKYFSLHVGMSFLAFLLPARGAAGDAVGGVGAADGGLLRDAPGDARRLWHSLVSDTVLAYWLVADAAVMLLVLAPLLVLSLLPGMKTAHTLLLLRAMPSPDVMRKVELLTAPRRKVHETVGGLMIDARSRAHTIAVDARSKAQSLGADAISRAHSARHNARETVSSRMRSSPSPPATHDASRTVSVSQLAHDRSARSVSTHGVRGSPAQQAQRHTGCSPERRASTPTSTGVVRGQSAVTGLAQRMRTLSIRRTPSLASSMTTRSACAPARAACARAAGEGDVVSAAQAAAPPASASVVQ